jgi:ubiquinone/menaquinone biosynthesis C-methylase UbiE
MVNNQNPSEEKEFQGGERLYLGKTESDENSINEHLERYKFALKKVPDGGVVVDAACGTGYGSEMLAEKAGKVIGLEINDHALQWARTHHQKRNIEYKIANLNEQLPVSSESCDAVASFETLEHIKDQNNMLSEFKRILKPGGQLVISSPDREIITDKAHTENKFHIHELSKKELVGLLRSHFTLEELYGQTKYASLPWYKRAIKLLVKLDVFKLRRTIVKVFGLKLVVHKHFSPIEYSLLEKVDPDSLSDYYVLLAVCRK